MGIAAWIARKCPLACSDSGFQGVNLIIAAENPLVLALVLQ